MLKLKKMSRRHKAVMLCAAFLISGVISGVLYVEEDCMGIFGWILLMLLIYPIVSLILHVSGKILMGFFGVIALLTIVCIALSFSKWIIGIAIVCGIFGLIGAGEK